MLARYSSARAMSSLLSPRSIQLCQTNARLVPMDQVPGAGDTENWPAPFPLKDSFGWASGIGSSGAVILVVFDYEGPAVALAGGRYVMALTFEALIDKPGLPRCQLQIEVTPSGPTCRRLVLSGSAEEPLTATRIRVPIREFVEDAAVLVGGFDQQGNRVEPETVKNELAAAALPLPQPGKRLPDETLASAAEVYRDAVRRGVGATDAVAEAFPISRSTAGRWIVEARRRGLLGPAIPGVAGELEQEEPPDG